MSWTVKTRVQTCKTCTDIWMVMHKTKKCSHIFPRPPRTLLLSSFSATCGDQGEYCAGFRSASLSLVPLPSVLRLLSYVASTALLSLWHWSSPLTAQVSKDWIQIWGVLLIWFRACDTWNTCTLFCSLCSACHLSWGDEAEEMLCVIPLRSIEASSEVTGRNDHIQILERTQALLLTLYGFFFHPLIALIHGEMWWVF